MSTADMDRNELGPLHWEIIDLMADGREGGGPWGYATPRYLADETGESRQLVSQRLRDLTMGDVVTKVTRGFYRLEYDEIPREGDDA